MKSVLVDIRIPADRIHLPDAVRLAVLEKAGLPNSPEFVTRIVRRSIDARSRMPRFALQVAIAPQDAPEPEWAEFRPVALTGKRVVIVGAGPAGYFAALSLLEHGITPVVLDRGKDVNERRKDIRKLYTEGLVNPDSNYCFGEGGAGTYSDGKLYTRSSKRGNVGRILDLFVAHGASPDIRIDAHAHIGSNKLPGIVRNLRQAILDAGGEVHFNTRVTDLLLDNGVATGVRLADGEIVSGEAVILATGHSARDIYRMLVAREVPVEAKPFALGVRIEHPQPLIDRIFYHHSPRHPNLPAASYRLTAQVEGRGVFSFCMCPGGYVVPASTAPGELVLNGMSMAERNAEFANSGLVVELRLEDIPGVQDDPLAGLVFQAAVEQAMFRAGDGVTQKAPAQRATDFLQGRISSNIGRTSYVPGAYAAPLHELLPEDVARRLGQGLVALGRKNKGYDSEEALLLGVESRTSSPVRIPRDRETMAHPAVPGLYPCGEGAGYAGGIVSAAMDGERVAHAVAAKLG